LQIYRLWEFSQGLISRAVAEDWPGVTKTAIIEDALRSWFDP
jgi:hypothetical protein